MVPVFNNVCVYICDTNALKGTLVNTLRKAQPTVSVAVPRLYEKMQAKIQQMQEQMNAAQEAVEAQEFTASVGGGVVEAKVNGKKEVLSVTIKPEAVDPEDVEMLQDLVVSAVNEALRQAGEAMDKGIEQATGGLDLGAFGL